MSLRPRAQADLGEVFFPGEEKRGRSRRWRRGTRQRWIEQGSAVFHAGRGNSMIASPNGRVLARCDHGGEGFAIATIDPAKSDKARAGHGQVATPIWHLYQRIDA